MISDEATVNLISIDSPIVSEIAFFTLVTTGSVICKAIRSPSGILTIIDTFIFSFVSNFISSESLKLS